MQFTIMLSLGGCEEKTEDNQDTGKNGVTNIFSTISLVSQTSLLGGSIQQMEIPSRGGPIRAKLGQGNEEEFALSQHKVLGFKGPRVSHPISLYGLQPSLGARTNFAGSNASEPGCDRWFATRSGRHTGISWKEPVLRKCARKKE